MSDALGDAKGDAKSEARGDTMCDADAVRAHYRAALARRLQAAPEAVQRRLQARLAGGEEPVTDADAGAAVRPAVTPSRSHPPSPLALLNQQLAALAPAAGPAGGHGPELRSARAFRDSWSRICAEDDVARAVRRGPENAGPLNSHRLVLRTLGLLRDLSPDYLRCFMVQADALLWLDQAAARLKAPAAKARPARTRSRPAGAGD